MAAGDKSAKTEKPTPKRLREARERGQIARSPDLAAWAGMLLTTVLLQATVGRGARAMRELLNAMGDVIADPSQERASAFFVDAMLRAAIVAAPLVLGLMLVGVAVSLAQVGLKPSAKRLKPDFRRLNAFRGIKRMLSPAAWWELGKSVAKVGLLAVVAFPAGAGLARQLSAGGSLSHLASLTARSSLSMMRNVAAASLVIAGIDYAVQRRRLHRELMMTRHEVQEELKQHEGNPLMRSAIRSRQHAMSRNRMIRMVATADVVVVNPTHVAVALKYEPDKGAPELVAKGIEHLALRIRLEAASAGVPVVREPALARAVYGACEIGQLIPAPFYEAVAQLLAFVYRLRAHGRADGFHEPRRAFLAEVPPEIDLREFRREHRRTRRQRRRPAQLTHRGAD
jgi:flagellar biosynthetic protein FlhB